MGTREILQRNAFLFLHHVRVSNGSKLVSDIFLSIFPQQPNVLPFPHHAIHRPVVQTQNAVKATEPVRASVSMATKATLSIPNADVVESAKLTQIVHQISLV